MVRFIIVGLGYDITAKDIFTFHYGQIYYDFIVRDNEDRNRFTFHYGQIYYKKLNEEIILLKAIYIPLWLDLL